MIETEEQRRWWFATHPEYSWSRTGRGGRSRRTNGKKSSRPSPEAIDAWADERLSYERDPVGIALIEAVKFWLGTEFASKKPEEQYSLLRDDDEAEEADDDVEDRSGDDWWSHQPFDHPAVSRDSYHQYEDVLDRHAAHRYQEWLEELRRADVGLERDPHTLLDLLPFRKLLTSPVQLIRDFFRSTAQGAVVNVVKRGEPESPGTWQKVCRGPQGLSHQSKMSGQPVMERNGKHYIKEYRVPSDPHPVHFDDFRDGILYEYKGPQGGLLNKDKRFHDWVKGVQGARNQAERQVEAARGIPVIWKVGADQVNAFRKALENIDGIIILP